MLGKAEKSEKEKEKWKEKAQLHILGLVGLKLLRIRVVGFR